MVSWGMGLAETKRLQRLYNQVARNRKNCPFNDVERLLLAAGFTLHKGSGSHAVFKCGQHTISVPRRNPVKENYVMAALEIVNRGPEAGEPRAAYLLTRSQLRPRGPSRTMDTASRIQEEIKAIATRPYTRELIRNSDGTWFARIIEFAGCMTEGATKGGGSRQSR